MVRVLSSLVAVGSRGGDGRHVSDRLALDGPPRLDDLARRGRPLAANTLGAAAGALAAGFILLPRLGLDGATAVGWPSISPRRRAPGIKPDERPSAAPTRRRRGAGSRRARSARTAGRPSRRSHDSWPAMGGGPGVGLTGFASLALQVVWTRLLASILGPTTYAFSAVAIFVLGIAGGSAAGGRLRAAQASAGTAGAGRGRQRPAALLGAAGVDTAVMAIARLVSTAGVTFGTVLLREWLVAAALLLPMALVFGAAFPLALGVASRADGAMVEDLGLVYAVNTVGAIAGALVTGFALVPWLGLHDTMRLLALLTAAGGVALAWRRAGGIARWAAVGRRCSWPGRRGWRRAGPRCCCRAAPTSTRRPAWPRSGDGPHRRRARSTTGRAPRPPWPCASWPARRRCRSTARSTPRMPPTC